MAAEPHPVRERQFVSASARRYFRLYHSTRFFSLSETLPLLLFYSFRITPPLLMFLCFMLPAIICSTRTLCFQYVINPLAVQYAVKRIANCQSCTFMYFLECCTLRTLLE